MNEVALKSGPLPPRSATSEAPKTSKGLLSRTDNGAFARWLWWLVVCAAVGLLLRIVFDFIPTEGLKAALEVPIKSVFGTEDLPESSTLLNAIISWTAAPALVILLGSSIYKLIKDYWNQLLGGRPDFTISDSFKVISEYHLIPAYDPNVFIGRRTTTLDLRKFVQDSNEAFCWKMIIGRTGIGKSRLCVDLVNNIRRSSQNYNFWYRFKLVRDRLIVQPPFRRAWDAGFVDPARAGEIDTWHPRRPTLLIFDEASVFFPDTLNHLLDNLSRKSTRRRPIRALVIDHIQHDPFSRILGTDLPVAGQSPTLVLEGMSDAELTELAKALDLQSPSLPAQLSEANGNPRSTIHMLFASAVWDYRDAMRHWANNIIPGLAPADIRVLPRPAIDADVAEALIAAALVGPVSVATLKIQDTLALQQKMSRFFPNSESQALQKSIPPFEPRELGCELALRLFDQLSEASRSSMVTMMLQFPNRLRTSLHEFWFELSTHRTSSNDSGLINVALELQARLDELEPDITQRLYQDITRHFAEITMPNDPNSIQFHLEIVRSYWMLRPFDPFVIDSLLNSEVNAAQIFADRGVLYPYDFTSLLNLQMKDWMSESKFKTKFLRILLNYARAPSSYFTRPNILAFAEVVESVLNNDKKETAGTLTAAMGVSANLIKAMFDTAMLDSLKSLFFAMRFVVGRVRLTAGRDFSENYARGLVNVLQGTADPKMAVAAASDLYDLCNDVPYADDRVMQLLLAAGAVNFMGQEAAPDSEKRKWWGRLEQIIERHSSSDDPELRAIVCVAMCKVIHRHAAAGRFDLAELAFARLVAAATSELGAIRSDCRGSLLKSMSCLLSHYISYERVDLIDAQIVRIRSQLVEDLSATAHRVSTSVMGLCDLDQMIEGWRHFNHCAWSAGRREVFVESLGMWDRFFDQLMRASRTNAPTLRSLQIIGGLLACAHRHASELGVDGDKLKIHIRRQAQLIHDKAPFSPQILEIARAVGAPVLGG